MAHPGFNLEAMREAVKSGRVQWQRRALERMMERRISRHDVLTIIERGERIEEHPDDTPLPGTLVMGFATGRPPHVVVAFDAGRKTAAIITSYKPYTSHFEEDLKTRRKT
jgi:hypothetical protein